MEQEIPDPDRFDNLGLRQFFVLSQVEPAS